MLTPNQLQTATGVWTQPVSRWVTLLLVVLALSSAGCCQFFGTCGGTVKFHVSNSDDQVTILLVVNGTNAGTVYPNLSDDFYVNVVDDSMIFVVINNADTGATLFTSTISVNPATQEEDISYLNGTVYLAINPISPSSPAANVPTDALPADDAPPKPAQRISDGVNRVGRSLLGK